MLFDVTRQAALVVKALREKGWLHFSDLPHDIRVPIPTRNLYNISFPDHDPLEYVFRVVGEKSHGGYSVSEMMLTEAGDDGPLIGVVADAIHRYALFELDGGMLPGYWVVSDAAHTEGTWECIYTIARYALVMEQPDAD